MTVALCHVAQATFVHGGTARKVSIAHVKNAVVQQVCAFVFASEQAHDYSPASAVFAFPTGVSVYLKFKSITSALSKGAFGS